FRGTVFASDIGRGLACGAGALVAAFAARSDDRPHARPDPDGACRARAVVHRSTDSTAVERTRPSARLLGRPVHRCTRTGSSPGRIRPRGLDRRGTQAAGAGDPAAGDGAPAYAA